MPTGDQAAAERRPGGRAFLWLLFLGPFFFLSYGFANWAAAQRAEVGAIVFGWEQSIPFLAWTIVPYWSIDLFYGVSLFVCATRVELDVHARRLLCAQLISTACFLLFPLRFTFDQPATDGLYGLMFDVLRGFDKPFNQAPSLHIALLVIIWIVYLRHLRGIWRWTLNAWFVLIAVSVLTTYQHHFIDLPTGLWLGWFCVWLFPGNGRPLYAGAALTGEARRWALALRYLAGAAATAVAGIWAGGWSLWLLYPAASLALVAAIYIWLGEAAYQKRPDGSIAPATWWLFGPYILGACVNSRWWTRAVPAANEVVPGLALGRIPFRNTPAEVRAIVDTTAELPCAGSGVYYRHVPQLDLVPPSESRIGQWVAAIDQAYARGPVLVCCALGFSRSATAVAAWLVATGRVRDHTEAIQQVRRARPAIVLDADHVGVLERYAQRRGGPVA